MTIEAVCSALAEIHDVTPVEADENFYDSIRRLRPDIVFNIAEGLNGVSREAQVPAMLDMLGIPYSGSDPLTLALCLDKSRTKEVLAHHRIPTPKFHLVESMEDVRNIHTALPVMVKPVHEGSSKGIFDASLARTGTALEGAVEKILYGYGQPAIVEEYLPGREFTVGIIGNGPDLRVLPVVEINFSSLPEGVNPIYSYEAKWLWDTIDDPLDIYECPARLDPALADEMAAVCERAYRILRCRDWSRIDVRLDAAGRPNIIEVNPLPGILPNPADNSCLPKAARAAGIPYNELIRSALGFAAIRHGLADRPVPVSTVI
ncbi:MAG TPA: ATP-grasp domain-containing protein [Bacteroidota bacterium]|nr:ATP-grasp domain-containing protein [Bacteroidota bacterium]